METINKLFELQIDEKPNGCVIRLNDEKGIRTVQENLQKIRKY